MSFMAGRRWVWASSCTAWPNSSPRSPNSTAPMRRLKASMGVAEAFQAHSAAALLDPIPDKVVDVGDGHTEVRQDTIPIAHAGTDEELVARLGEGGDLAVENGAGIVTPDEHDGILGNIRQVAGMLQDDVPPHHHALMIVVAEQVVNAPDVADIHASYTDARRQFA